VFNVCSIHRTKNLKDGAAIAGLDIAGGCRRS
jgi:hypothetical protein